MTCFCIFSADQGFKLEEEWGEDQGRRLGSHQAVELAEQLGDLYCKVGCYSKALGAYQAQVRNLKRQKLVTLASQILLPASTAFLISRTV